MNGPSEQQVVELLRLRGSAPLPNSDYFAELRRRIIENLNGHEDPKAMSWLERLGVRFDLSPALVGAVGVSVFSLLAGALLVAAQDRPLHRTDRPLVPLELGPLASSFVGWPGPLPAAQPKPVPRPEAVPRSTEPVTTFSEAGSALERWPVVQPVNYSGAARPN